MSVSSFADLAQRNGPILFPFRLAGSVGRRILHRLNTLRWRLVGVSIGEGSTIELGVVIGRPRGVRIGRNCRIAHRVKIVAELGGGTLEMGDNVTINEGVRLDHTGALVIGDDALLSHEAVVYTHSHGIDPRSRPLPLSLRIGKGAWIGARAMIMANVDSIGHGAVVAAGSIVTKNVPVSTVVGGNPAKTIRTL